MRGVLTRAAFAAVARAAAVEAPPGGWGLWLTPRWGCGRALGDPLSLRRNDPAKPARHWGPAAATAAARGGDTPSRITGAYARNDDAAANSGPVGVVGLSHVQRRAVGISPQSCSVVSLAFFSSGGLGTDYRLLNQSISASTDLRAILKVVRDSHQDFRPRDASLACHRLAKHAGKLGQTIKSDEDVLTFRLATKAAVRQASRMKPQEISNTLWAFGTLAAKGVEVDVDAVRAVSREAPRVVGEMKPREISNTLFAIAKLAERGVEVDAAAVQAVSREAPRVAGEMNPQEVSNMLFAMAKLAERGVEVDAAVVRAVSKRAPCVSGEMIPQAVSITLWAMAKLAERGVEVDAVAVRAVSSEVPRVARGMKPQELSNTLWAMAKLAEMGLEVDLATVQPVSREVPRMAREMNAQHVSITLWAMGKLAERGVTVDVAAVQAVSKEAPRVAGEMTPQGVALTLCAWGKFSESRFELASILDQTSWHAVITRGHELSSQMTTQDRVMLQQAVKIITTASAGDQAQGETEAMKTNPPPTSKRASASFWAAAARWSSKLPTGKRTKLDADVLAAETEDGKVWLLVASAEADTTKVRAVDKQVLLEAAAAHTAKPCHGRDD